MGSWFLRRSDGQLLAAALLALKPSPYGYLVSGESLACRNMLCQAADSLPQLLARTIWSIDAFSDVTDHARESLGASMKSFDDLFQPPSRTRRYFNALYELDMALDLALKEHKEGKEAKPALEPAQYPSSSPLWVVL